MGEVTGIQWTHHTFNPWIGCTRISPGCDHCYAEAGSKRLAAQHGLDLWGGDVYRTGISYWRMPERWDRAAAKARVRRRVFCASFADVFEDRPEVEQRRVDLLRLIQRTPHLDWLLLTKRPENMMRMTVPTWGDFWPRNAWAGTTVEDQERADTRIPELSRVRARVRFLSMEPLLGPVDLSAYVFDREAVIRRAMSGPAAMNREQADALVASVPIDWVIIGGESGAHARTFDVDWARHLLAQCKSAHVPVFVKQLGARPLLRVLGWGAPSLEGSARPIHPIGKLDLVDPKGSDPSEWPADLRVREFPR